MAVVSIGLPVYNGGRYLGDSIRSLLHQSYGDFEVIIVDNASTDNTEILSREFACLDSRVKYFRNTRNIGAAPNFNLAFQYAQGKYFRWMAHDDICATEYLEKCVDKLENDKTIILCHTDVQFIDDQSKIVAKDYEPVRNIYTEHVEERFRELIDLKHWCIDIFGLIRKDALERTGLIRDFVGSDRNLLVELGLMGRFFRIKNHLFYHREHTERSTRRVPIHERSNWWNPNINYKFHMPHWSLAINYYYSVKRAQLSSEEKKKCYKALFDWCIKYYGKLYWDIKVVSKNCIPSINYR